MRGFIAMLFFAMDMSVMLIAHGLLAWLFALLFFRIWMSMGGGMGLWGVFFSI